MDHNRAYLKWILSGVPVMGIYWLLAQLIQLFTDSYSIVFWVSWFLGTLPTYVFTYYFVFKEK